MGAMKIVGEIEIRATTHLPYKQSLHVTLIFAVNN